MPRIKLATWYGDKAPGDELDVDDIRLKALLRDGLVAEVVGERPPTFEPEPAPAGEPAVRTEPGRRKR
ncbi:hypothetical protein [Streptomyces cadmiisoli]|uniref:hypothetical protein n=1 Tax=Streptomyces cadmiisoli TaxID=2184053 RepID=UPI0036645ACA